MIEGNTENLRIAWGRWGMEKQLAHLWREAFGDGERETALFFRNRWRPENSLVIEENGRVISALYLLPCQMETAGGRVQAHYIYGAATLQAFRGKGYMGALIEAAAKAGQARGDYASVLLPGEERLYEFYRRFGYRTVFGVEEITLTREEIFARCPEPVGTRIVTGRECAAIRNQCLKGRKGSVLWDAPAVQYALWSHDMAKGKAFFVPGGYCLINCDGIVQEWMGRAPAAWQALAEAARQTGRDSFQVRLPVGSPLLPQRGKICPWGMMRPLQPAVLAGFPADGTPYLGLTME